MHLYFKGKGAQGTGGMEQRIVRSLDNATVRQRLQAVFGDYWALNFIVPQPWFPNHLTSQYKSALMHAYTRHL